MSKANHCAVEGDESGWCIERHRMSELRYWDGTSVRDESFVPQHTDAIRFARQVDASRVLSWLLGGHGRVAEHLWCAPSIGGSEASITARRDGESPTPPRITPEELARLHDTVRYIREERPQMPSPCCANCGIHASELVALLHAAEAYLYRPSRRGNAKAKPARRARGKKRGKR